MKENDMTSVRMPADLVAGLRKRGEETGESISDLLRQGALLILGICPTCGHETKEYSVNVKSAQ